MEITNILSSSMAVNAIATAITKLEGGQEALDEAIAEVQAAAAEEEIAAITG